ncbi:ATP-dependent metallopeptidase [Mycena indigotica]|uniref:ATP-dependent metallopeptidase n=1 Tax=Mycena indigotica TaxID=2126181 RepID=A0A8H6W5R3_9AGAR|nr:ATP-dependent metallopeptidase [Mycena indigotica]KAF7306809.1 ATP-dependent metallopeptidase [Mycena indigotica]
MDFTELYRFHGNLAFSPNSRFILAAIQNRLVLRTTSTFQIFQTWQIDQSPTPTNALFSSKDKTSSEPISHIGWSCDSEYLLAASTKQGTVHVYNVQDINWSARIESGTEGLVKAEWAPDGRTILCFSQWGLRVTIWSLVTGVASATYIQFPVHPDTGYAFRSDGRYFILAERHKSKDTLGVYDTQDSYKLVRHFPLPTSALASLALSPTGNHFAVWEGPIEYKLHVLSLAGDLQGSFSPDSDPGFGIRRVSWHPSGMFLAVGGWDDKIHILDLTWTVAATLELSARIPSGVVSVPFGENHPNGRRQQKVEVSYHVPNYSATKPASESIADERLRSPHSIVIQRADMTKSNPKSGTAQLEWNKNGSLLLVRFDNSPNALHIFDFPTMEQPEFRPRLRSVLLHSRPIAHARWNPVRKGSLILCCASQSLYMWSDEWVGENGEEEMAECIGVPAKSFETRDIRWTPDGKGVVLLDSKDSLFCCAFEVEDA